MVKLDASSMLFRIVFVLFSLIPCVTFIVGAVYWKKLKEKYDASAKNSGAVLDYGVSRQQMGQMYGMMIFLSIIFAVLTAFALYLLVVPAAVVDMHKDKLRDVVDAAATEAKKDSKPKSVAAPAKM